MSSRAKTSTAPSRSVSASASSNRASLTWTSAHTFSLSPSGGQQTRSATFSKSTHTVSATQALQLTDTTTHPLASVSTDTLFSFSSGEWAACSLAVAIVLFTWLFSLWKWLSGAHRQRVKGKHQKEMAEAERLRASEIGETHHASSSLSIAAQKVREEERRRNAEFHEEDVAHADFNDVAQREDDAVGYLLPSAAVVGVAPIDTSLSMSIKELRRLHPVLNVTSDNAQLAVLRKVHRSNGIDVDGLIGNRNARVTLASAPLSGEVGKAVGTIDVMFVSDQVEPLPLTSLPWLTNDEVDAIEAESGYRQSTLAGKKNDRTSGTRASSRESTALARSFASGKSLSDSFGKTPSMTPSFSRAIPPAAARPLSPKSRSFDDASVVSKSSSMSKMMRVMSERSRLTAQRTLHTAVSDLQSQSSNGSKRCIPSGPGGDWEQIARHSHGLYQHQTSPEARIRNVERRLHSGSFGGGLDENGRPKSPPLSGDTRLKTEPTIITTQDHFEVDNDLDEETFRGIELDDDANVYDRDL